MNFPRSDAADPKFLHSPDEMNFCSGRHCPANTFPPVLVGLSIFPGQFNPVGFYPIYKSRRLNDVFPDKRIENRR
jgi:hypothetical protein